jgi:hypothetical protein
LSSIVPQLSGGVKPPNNLTLLSSGWERHHARQMWHTFDDIGLTPLTKRTGSLGLPARPAAIQQSTPRAFTRYTMSELDAQPHLRSLVRGLLHEGSIGMLVGASMSFKTFIALDMALHMAYGRKYLGLPTKHGTVAYVAGEGRIKLRVQAWRTYHGIPTLSDRFIAYETHSTLYDKATIDQLAGDLAPAKPQLVWLDTLNACFSGMEENSAKDGGLTIELMRRLSHRLGGAAVIALHHPSRANKKQERGSTSLLAGSDVVFLCHRPNPLDYRVELCHLKQKDDAPMTPTWYELENSSLGLDDEGFSLTSLVPVPSEAPPREDADSSSRLREKVLAALQQEELTTKALWKAVGGTKDKPSGSFSEFLTGLKDAGWIAKPGGERGKWRLADSTGSTVDPVLPVLPVLASAPESTHLDLVQPAA